jgi:hypothetical protein
LAAELVEDLDEWVFIDVQKELPDKELYNKPEILRKESDIKDETESECILISKNASFTNPSLRDFTIKKVIDKGSFGKVFLV